MRTVLAVIAGYVVMVAGVLLGIAVIWFSLGAKFAFDGNTAEASIGWSMTMLIAGFMAAVVGGIAAGKVAGETRRSAATKGLVGLIVVFGMLTVITQLMSAPAPLPEGKTIENLTFTEAGQYARSPTWYNVGIVVVGVAGVIVGSKAIRQPQ